MNAINDGGPAFPVPHPTSDGPLDGMTLRDYFAAKAMQAACTKFNIESTKDVAVVAKGSYIMADAMLKARQA